MVSSQYLKEINEKTNEIDQIKLKLNKLEQDYQIEKENAACKNGEVESFKTIKQELNSQIDFLKKEAEKADVLKVSVSQLENENTKLKSENETINNQIQVDKIKIDSLVDKLRSSEQDVMAKNQELNRIKEELNKLKLELNENKKQYENEIFHKSQSNISNIY